MLGIPVGAAENGLTQWPLGVQTVVPAILPPAGVTQFYSYTLLYSAPKFTDSKGRSVLPGFDAGVGAQAGRLVHTWRQFDSGFGISSGLILAGNQVNIDAAGASDRHTGLNFLYLTPAYLTYKTGSLNLLWGPSVFIPASAFNKNNLANVTNNYYSFNNEFALTYMPTPRWEISAQNVITVNGRNDATNYKSGTVVNTDFGVNYAAVDSMPNLFFGINGFYTQQISDDKLDGIRVGNGNRLSKFSIGPQIIYYVSPGVGILAKWQKEVMAENTTKGDRFWIQFTMPISTGK